MFFDNDAYPPGWAQGAPAVLKFHNAAQSMSQVRETDVAGFLKKEPLASERKKRMPRRPTKDPLVVEGRKKYRQLLRVGKLNEKRDHGKWVMINLDSIEFIIGDSSNDVARTFNKRFSPDARGILLQVGITHRLQWPIFPERA